MFKQIDWEIRLDGETYSGCMNLHKPADLERVLAEIQSEIEEEAEERAEHESH